MPCPGTTSRSATPKPTVVTDESPHAPCKSCPRPMICPSRTSTKSSCSNATSQTSPAHPPPLSPCWGSPARPRTKQAHRLWPRRYAATGASSRCIGYVTPSTAKTTRPCTPDPDPESWQPSATSRSEHYTWPDAPTSPKPPDGPAADPTDHSPSSNSQQDLETTVGVESRRGASCTNTFARSKPRWRRSRTIVSVLVGSRVALAPT